MAGQNLQGILETAINQHRAGNIAEAEKLYRQVLAVSPDQPDALHYLGVVALQCGKPQIAVELIGRSLAIHPSSGAQSNLGEAMRALGKLTEAVDCFRKALALDPRQANAAANLGATLASMNQLPEAERSLRQAIALAPNHVAAWASLAKLLDTTDRPDDAVAAWERVIRLAPGQYALHRSLGSAWIRAGDSYRAISELRKAIEQKPDDAESHSVLAKAYDAVNKPQESIAAARQSVALAPDQWKAHYDLAGYLQKNGSSAEALEACDRAIALNPNDGSLYKSRAIVLKNLGRFDEMGETLNRGLEISPADARLHAALSAFQFMQRDFASATKSAQSAATLEPHSVEGHASLAFALLAAGGFEEGFKEYEWRWRDSTFTTKPRDFSRPMWDGSDPSGRTILVHCEQGYGDIFQFLRYLPMIRARGARVIFEVLYKVANLVRGLAGDIIVVVAGTMLPDFDLHVPLMSLPAIFHTTLQTIPATVPYLSADPARALPWRSRMEPIEGLVVGLVWAGSPKPDPKRSAKFADFASLGTVPGVSFIAMQPEPQASEADHPPAGMKLKNLGPDLRDFSDTTASVLANLDLLITIDTGVAHLAGAMGIPTWVLLPYSTDWRWVHADAVNLWYPTVRLFRQNSRDDWAPVVERVTEQLRRVAQSRSHLFGMLDSQQIQPQR